MITVYIILLSGEVIPYSCQARKGKTKFLTHRDNIQELVLNHLKLDKNEYIVNLFHDDDDEKLQEEHNTRIEKWREKGKDINNINSHILPSNYDETAIRIFKQQRDSNRYYEDGSIVRVFVKKFNYFRKWNELKDN